MQHNRSADTINLYQFSVAAAFVTWSPFVNMGHRVTSQ